MTVRDLIKELIDQPMNAQIEIAAKTDHDSKSSTADDIEVRQESDYWVVIKERNEYEQP